MTQGYRLSSLPRLGVRLGASLLLATMLAGQASAQSMTNSFGGLSQNSGEPIDIESDVLVVHDAKKYATFKGNVKAVQGGTTLKARELDVHYVGSGQANLTGGGGGTGGEGESGEAGTQISKIEARGEVVITSDQDQTTTSDWALYDVPAQLVTVGGNVVLMQGKNVLKGDRLVIDLKTGESRFENRGSAANKGRIRALFVPNDAKAAGKDKDKDKSKRAEPEEASSSEAAGAAAQPESAPAANPWQLLEGGRP